jgi:hypothetical protein
MKGSIVEGFDGLGIRVAFLSLLILGAASPAYAGQSGAPPPSTSAAAPAAAPATAAPAAKPAAPAGQAVATGEPAAKGTQEGIKVHGHWTIEVRNPDGKVVTHTEFENALVTNQSVLAGLLTGTASFGDWQVVLGTSNGSTGPCGTLGTFPCFLGQSGSSGFPSGIQCALYGECFTTLQSSVVGTYLNTVQLTGTATAGGSGQIGFVETLADTCTNSSGVGLATVSPSSCFTNGGAHSTLTSATLSSPVAVIAQQTIAVTVVISFQ